MNSFIEETLKAALLERESFEHKDRLYPTQSSTFVDYDKYKKLHGKCIRASYYSCIGLKEESNLSETEQISRALQQLEGDCVEKALLDIFDRQGILLDKGLKFEIPKYKIFGKLDGVIKVGNKIVGVEVKSIGGNNQYAVNDVFGSQWNKPYPRWQNLFQTLIYCYAFRGIIDTFLLYYQRRDTGERKVFSISIEPVKGKTYPVIDGVIDYRFTINEMLERYELLSYHLEKEVVPEREFQSIYPKELIKDYYKLGVISKKRYEKYSEEPFGDFECAFCGFKKRCDGE